MWLNRLVERYRRFKRTPEDILLELVTDTTISAGALQHKLLECFGQVDLRDLSDFDPQYAISTQLMLRHQRITELTQFFTEINVIIANGLEDTSNLVSRVFGEPKPVTIDLYFTKAGNFPIDNLEALNNLRSILILNADTLDAMDPVDVSYYHRLCYTAYRDIAELLNQLTQLKKQELKAKH